MSISNILKISLFTVSLSFLSVGHAQTQPVSSNIAGGYVMDMEAEPDEIKLSDYTNMTNREAVTAQIREIEGALTLMFQGEYEQAIALFKEASATGNPLAMNSLGVMYAQGLGVEVDLAESRLWYQVAVDHDSKDAYYNLAVMYAEGEGGEVDLEYAKELFEKACEFGDEEACSYMKDLPNES